MHLSGERNQTAGGKVTDEQNVDADRRDGFPDHLPTQPHSADSAQRTDVSFLLAEFSAQARESDRT